jgi:hypothetical protein
VGRGWVIASLPIVERWIVEPSMDIRSSVWVVSVLSALWGCGVLLPLFGRVCAGGGAGAVFEHVFDWVCLLGKRTYRTCLSLPL